MKSHLTSKESLRELISQYKWPAPLNEQELNFLLTVLQSRIETVISITLEEAATIAAGTCARKGVKTKICQEVADQILAIQK